MLIGLDEDEVRAAVAAAVGAGVQAIAILFLHSYANPVHEQRAKAIAEACHPGLFVTASHELSREYREFERTSTAAANAYVGPRVRRYLAEMRDHLAVAGFDGDFLIVQSTGGLFDLDEAQHACVRMLESGPAAGVIGTKALCDSIGLANAIAFDMGGTTAKAGVIHNGDVLMTGSAMIGGYATGLPLQIPMIDIQEVGTGGGSIARVEAGGALHVGPESAGAAPGPVCYGLGGTEPTVTDANLILGRLGADRFLGGEMRLDLAAARRALIERVAEPLDLDPTAAADGILRIAATKMSHVVRWVTTERGLDAARFRPRRLWRRRAAACGDGRARAAHRQGGDPARARAFLRLRHAARRPAARFRQHLVHAAGGGVVRRAGGALRRDGAARPRCGRERLQGPRRHHRDAAAPTCAMSGRSTRCSWSCRRRCSRRRTATASSSASMPSTRPATAIPRPPRRPRSSACAAPSPGLLRKPPFERIAQGGAVPADGRLFAAARAVYFAELRLCGDADL